MEEVRVSLTEYMGHWLTDLRGYAIRSTEEPVPTKKGLTLSVKLYGELKDAILEAGGSIDWR